MSDFATTRLRSLAKELELADWPKDSAYLNAAAVEVERLRKIERAARGVIKNEKVVGKHLCYLEVVLNPEILEGGDDGR